MYRLDKNVFKKGFAALQNKLEERFYTTTLRFTHDLCQAVNVGINTPINAASADEQKADAVDASPAKQNIYWDVRERRRLGKRILKTIQPQLEAALKAEADICGRPLDALLKELEGMLEASLEIKQPTITVSQEETALARETRDVEMTDAPEEAQIIVADQSDNEADADVDGVGRVENDANDEGDRGDPMETDSSAPVGNIEVNTSDHEEGTSRPNGIISSDSSAAGEQPPHAVQEQRGSPTNKPANGFSKVDSGSPPSLSGFGPASLQPPRPSDPLTPPQSNGSFGRDPANVLCEGGVPWYLQGFEVQGTSAVEEQWTGRDAVRSLSEELTDMDDDALKDLEFDVDDDTITASPVNTEGDGNGNGNKARRKERANPAKFRKGVRSSTRRR